MLLFKCNDRDKVFFFLNKDILDVWRKVKREDSGMYLGIIMF